MNSSQEEGKTDKQKSTENKKNKTCKGSYFVTLIVLQVLGSFLQIGVLALMGYIRMKKEYQLLHDLWYILFALLTLLTINLGAMTLCFRRQKFVYLQVICELALLVLFSSQIYLFIVHKDYNRKDQDGEETMTEAIIDGSLKLPTLVSVSMQMGRFFIFVFQILIICFRLKY